MNGTLYIIGTPIGNLNDTSFRAIETLKCVDLVLAEDTRVTKKLLSHFEISKPIWRFDEYAAGKSYETILQELKKEKSIAFVTDAGTPGIADPGWKLVRYIRTALSEVRIVPIPGASAIVTLLSASGVNADQFIFLGYPPHKKGRQTFFKQTAELKIRPIVLYESPHRLQKTFSSLVNVFGFEKEIVVGRELTKVYEEIFHGSIQSAQAHFVGNHAKGEFVIAIS